MATQAASDRHGHERSRFSRLYPRPAGCSIERQALTRCDDRWRIILRFILTNGMGHLLPQKPARQERRGVVWMIMMAPDTPDAAAVKRATQLSQRRGSVPFSTIFNFGSALRKAALAVSAHTYTTPVHPTNTTPTKSSATPSPVRSHRHTNTHTNTSTPTPTHANTATPTPGKPGRQSGGWRAHTLGWNRRLQTGVVVRPAVEYR